LDIDDIEMIDIACNGSSFAADSLLAKEFI